MKRVLITGANGFVGRHVSQFLLSNRWDVRGVIRTQAATEQLPAGTEPFIVDSIDGHTNWDGVLGDVEAIVHLAARVHVLHDKEWDPLEAYREVNVEGTRALLNACIKNRVRRFIFMSSVKAVGEETSPDRPYAESYLCQPEDPYGVSKVEAERIVLEAHKKGDIECVILRPPMVYGPGVKANMLRLIKAVERGVPLPLAKVKNRRSMLFVDNLADAVNMCLTHSNASGEVFFVADEEVLSTSELIIELARCMKKKPRLLPVPVTLLRLLLTMMGKRAEIDRLTSSLEISTVKIRKRLNWTPPYSVYEGLYRTVSSSLG